MLNKELVETGMVPVYSANVTSPFGMTDKLLIETFETPSILWGIDGDWMVNIIPAHQQFYPTDHCGVLRVKDENIFNAHFVMYMLEKEGERVGFTRTYRASIDRIGSLSIPRVPIAVQNSIMEKVEDYERKINKQQQKIKKLEQRRRQLEDQLFSLV